MPGRDGQRHRQRDRGRREGRAAYVTGSTDSGDYPTTAGAHDLSHNGLGDAFVAKVRASTSEGHEEDDENTQEDDDD